MKNQTSLKNILGLTQEEAAMYFGVSKGHWSMFVIGKRDLPLKATIKLTAVLQHLKAEKPLSEARQQLDKAELEKLQHKLQYDYTTIKMKQYKLAQKISSVENIRAECFAALEVADFLDKQEEKLPFDSFAETIRLRAIRTLKQHDLYALKQLQLKKENLEILKTTLEKKIKTLEK
jgi:transcriptional regulator with XRE-family HTH domain